jgi:hypothetical protein
VSHIPPKAAQLQEIPKGGRRTNRVPLRLPFFLIREPIAKLFKICSPSLDGRGVGGGNLLVLMQLAQGIAFDGGGWCLRRGKETFARQFIVLTA